MTVKGLIEELQKYDENLVVTTNNCNGYYQDVTRVGLQEWKDRDGGRNASVTLFLCGYDPTLTKLGKMDACMKQKK